MDDTKKVEEVAVVADSVPGVVQPKKSRNTVLIVIIAFLAVGLVCATTVAALLIFGVVKFESESTSEGDVEEEDIDEDADDDSGDVADADDGADADADDTADDDTAADDDTGGGLFDDYLTAHYDCDGYGGTPIDQYYMDIEYPDVVTVLSPSGGEAISDVACNLSIIYEDNTMHMNFNVGEAYPDHLEAGYVELATVSGRTLVQTKIESDADSYYYAYMWLQSDADCAPNVIDETLSPPCALPIHPFLPGATMVGVTIPIGTGASEMGDIVDLFNDIAIRMTGGSN